MDISDEITLDAMKAYHAHSGSRQAAMRSDDAAWLRRVKRRAQRRGAIIR